MTHTTPCVLDVQGLPCPVPILRLAQLVRTLAPGTRVQVLGTDPALHTDLAAYCTATGHRLLSLQADGAVIVGWVEVAPVQR